MSTTPTAPAAHALSPARLAANRANAQRSTGPRTPEGKARSAQNAATHRLFCTSDLGHLDDSPADAADRADFHQALLDDLDPRSPLELLLADRYIGQAWRLRRLHLSQHTAPAPAPVGQYLAAETALQSLLSRTLKELRQLQSDRRKQTAAAAATTDPDPDPEPDPVQPDETPSPRPTLTPQQNAAPATPPAPPAPLAANHPQIPRNEPTCHFGSPPHVSLKSAQDLAVTAILNRKRTRQPH